MPWWFYQMMTTIISVGGWPLVIVVSGLILAGTIKTKEELDKYLKDK